MSVLDGRWAMHPEAGGLLDPATDPALQPARRPTFKKACACEQRNPCPIHDPVVAEGDWDA